MTCIQHPEFATWMAPFAPHQSTRRIAVAVSGGADSMALAHLLSQWGNPHALIVDHGLRRGSADEAALAAARLQARKIPADIITLRHLRPGGQRARHARYDALSDACARLGLTDLATAHHAQDQAETVLIRQAARSGPAGIAGMAASIIHGPVRILRPLLHVAPARLRATLRHAGLAWSEDPSNANPASPRARLRAAFHQTPAMIADALAIAATAGPRRQATEQAIAAELAESCTIYPHGFALTKNLSAPALSALIWTLSGRSHPPAPAAIARLVPLRAATLHGVRISPAGRSGPGWLLTRESTARPDPRFRAVTTDAEQSSVSTRPKWPAIVQQSGTFAPGLLFDPPRPAGGGVFVAAPSHGGDAQHDQAHYV